MIAQRQKYSSLVLLVVAFIMTPPVGSIAQCEANEVASLQLGQSCHELLLLGEYALVANYENGLRIINVADRANPILAHSINPAGLDFYSTLALTGPTLFVTKIDSRGSFAAINIDTVNPQNSSILASRIISDEPSGARSDIAVENGLLAVVEGNTLHFFDVKDPSDPQPAGTYPAGAADSAVALSDGLAYLNDSSTNELLIIDVSNLPATPLIGSAHTGVPSSTDLVISDGYAYLASESLVTIDVSDPANPVVVDTLALPSTPCSQIAIDGSRMMVGTFTPNSYLLDRRDPSAPRVVGAFTADEPNPDARAIALDGQFAFAAYSGGVENFRVIELTSCPIGSDLNSDGSVNASDLAILLAAWGPCAPLCPADLDGDNAVGSADLAVLLAAWQS